MKELAEKYNLNFSSFEMKKSLEKENKVCKIDGKINNHNIEILDYFKTIKGMGTLVSDTPLGYTRLTKDSISKDVKGYYRGFTYAEEIEKWLSAISKNEEFDVKDSIYPLKMITK
jgi:hypothetical protein